MLLFYQGDIGKATEWGEAAGINGYVLFALCTIMILLFGLLSWQSKRNDNRFERVMKTHEDRDEKFIEALNAINREMSKNALDITKPMVESNLRQIDIQTDISEVKRNQAELAALTEVEMGKVASELKNVSNHLEIMNQTVKNVYKNN